MNIKDFGPCYDFSAPNKPAELLPETLAQIRIEDDWFEGTATVTLEFLPAPRIVAHGVFPAVPLEIAVSVASDRGWSVGKRHVREFHVGGNEVFGFVAGTALGATPEVGSLAIDWELLYPWFPWSAPDDSEISSLIFHVFYYGVPRCAGIRHQRELEQPGYLLEMSHIPTGFRSTFNDWRVSLNYELPPNLIGGIPHGSLVLREVIRQGGFLLTHVGLIERTDGSTFTGKDAFSMVSALELFLTFFKGSQCEPVCPVGFDSEGNRVWSIWSAPLQVGPGWEDWLQKNEDTDLLKEYSFPGFMSMWQDQEWRRALPEVINWYCDANDLSRRVESGIICAQTALERLAFEYCIRRKKLLTPDGFRRLSAADQIRLLLGSLEIPNAIPESDRSWHPRRYDKLTQFIEKMPKSQKWVDAPHALTEVRNSVIHPEKKRYGSIAVEEVYEDAWHLGVKLVKECILALWGYNVYGEYPWEKEATED